MSSLAAQRALRTLGVAVLASVALLPFLPQIVKSWPALAPLQRAADVWFDFHCERDPARTFNLFGTPLAVCARCSGIYFGLGAGALIRRPHLTPRALRYWVGFGAAFMLLDVTLETRDLHGAWAALRVFSGMLLAYPVGAGLGDAIASPRRDRGSEPVDDAERRLDH